MTYVIFMVSLQLQNLSYKQKMVYESICQHQSCLMAACRFMISLQDDAGGSFVRGIFSECVIVLIR